MIKVRASSLPLAMSCSNAVLNPDGLLWVEKEFAAAEVGNIIHRLAERYITTGEYNEAYYGGRLDEIDGYDRAVELKPHIMRVWDKAKMHFKAPKVEQYLEAAIRRSEGETLEITGHLDVSEVQGKRAFILDWKTGRVRDDHYHQVAAYAYLLWYNHEGVEEVHATVCYAEDGTLYQYVFTTEQLQEWADGVHEQLGRERYVVSRRCVHCPLSKTCAAHEAHRRTAVSTVTSLEIASLRDLAPSDRAAVITKLKIVEEAVKDVRSAIKDDVRANGPMETGDGREFKIITSRTRKLNPARALEALEKHVTPKQLMDAASFSLPKLELAAGKNAPNVKGAKAEAVKAMIEDLDVAGAIFNTKQERLECRKQTKKL